jgi:putative endonuclease
MAASLARRFRSATAYRAGLAAEASVQKAFEAAGHVLAARRWRGPGGEIDLIFRRGGEIVFVEVKKSASFEQAAERLTRSQMERIHASAACFLEGEISGSLTQSRFDVALVDATGQVRIIENAFALA